MIGVRRKVAEHVLTRRVRGCRPAEARHWIGNPDLDGLHNTAGRILDGALNGAGTAKALGLRATHADRREGHHDLDKSRENLDKSLRSHGRHRTKACELRRPKQHEWSVQANDRLPTTNRW